MLPKFIDTTDDTNNDYNNNDDTNNDTNNDNNDNNDNDNNDNNIQKLYMCNDGLSAESCVLMSEILLGHGSCATLKVLNFYNNMSGSVGGTAIAEIVKACPVLEDFRFSATRCMAEGCMSLAKAFATRTTLKRVDVSDNSFGAEAAAELAESLKLNVGLEYINLRDDGLSAKGTKAVLKALSEGARSKTSFGKLSVLDLSGNEIDEDIVEALGQTMSSLKTLKQLFLDDNEFGSDGCPVIAKSLKGLSSLVSVWSVWSVCLYNAPCTMHMADDKVILG